MKNLYFSFIVSCLILTFIPASGAEDLKPSSKVTQAIVYPDAVLVTRSMNVNLIPGTHQVILDNIVSEIDENSLTVKGEGSASVKIHGAYLKRGFLKQFTDQRVDELNKKILEVSDKIALQIANSALCQ